MIQSRRPLHGLFLFLSCLLFIVLTVRHLGQVSISYVPFHAATGDVVVPDQTAAAHQQVVIANTSVPTATQETDELVTSVSPSPSPSPYPTMQPDEACAWMPNTSDILVVMKTGASESFGKVPTQLMTTLRCLPDYLIFSDMRQTINGVDIHDSLETVLDEAQKDNPDFDLYRQQKACAIDQESCNKLNDASSAGWNLDKYKNIHMAEKTYRMRPGYDWYIFVDADTYVLWPNLVQWLSKLRATKKHYLGSVAMVGDLAFGHGGSGYVLSKATMAEFAGKHDGVANQYDNKIHASCCGDAMFAKAVKDTTNMDVQNAWPTINGEKPYTLPFGPTHWCQPVVTMHHLNSEEVSSFWEFERDFFETKQSRLNPTRTLLLKDIYYKFLAPKLWWDREDWDNLSEDVYYLAPNSTEHEDWQKERTKKEEDMSDAEKEAYKSFDHCKRMCDDVGECMQYRFHQGMCTYSKAFMMGKPMKKEEDATKRWKSGWPLSKIHAWIEEQGECIQPDWPQL